jgi:hypothetical protein
MQAIAALRRNYGHAIDHESWLPDYMAGEVAPTA